MSFKSITPIDGSASSMLRLDGRALLLSNQGAYLVCFSEPYYPEELENVVAIADDEEFRHAPEDCTNWDERCPEWAAAGR